MRIWLFFPPSSLSPPPPPPPPYPVTQICFDFASRFVAVWMIFPLLLILIDMINDVLRLAYFTLDIVTAIVICQLA